MIRMDYVKTLEQAVRLASGYAEECVGMSVFDGRYYGGTKEALEKIGCVNIMPANTKANEGEKTDE